MLVYRLYGPNSEAMDDLVKRLCTQTGSRRRPMPVTGWLRQTDASLGEKWICWTKEGLRRYVQSGLLGWQCSVVQDEIFVREYQLSSKSKFQDEHQVICSEEQLTLTQTWDLVSYLDQLGYQKIKDKVVFYITRGDATPGDEIVVLEPKQPHCGCSLPSCEMPHALGTTRVPNAGVPVAIDRAKPLRKVGKAVSYDFTSKEFESVHYVQGQSSAAASCTWMAVDSARRSLPRLEARKLHRLPTNSLH